MKLTFDPPLILAPKRTGSTILQNIVHLIYYQRMGCVLKKHEFIKVNTPVIIPIRDPRDVALSHYRLITDRSSIYQKDLTFLDDRRIQTNLVLMQQLYQYYHNQSNALILRYEDLYEQKLGNYEKILQQLSEFLGFELSDQLKQLINQSLNINSIKKRSEELKTWKNYDNNFKDGYCIHGNHVESIEIKKWNDKIAPHLIPQINNRLKNLIKILNYE